MNKYIFREVAPERMDTSFYFDGDCFNARSGDYCNTIFLLSRDRGRYYGYNDEEYNRILYKAKDITSYFDDYSDMLERYNLLHKDYPEIVSNPHDYILLTKWYEEGVFIEPIEEPEDIANFLTIITHNVWNTKAVYGYNQGDNCIIIYCIDNYKNPSSLGEIWLGCCKEFDYIKIYPDGTEEILYSGTFIADSEVKTEEDYKKILSTYEECSYIELIESSKTITVYDYRRI